MKRLLLLLACLLALCTGVCAAEPVISEMKTDCTLTGSSSCQVTQSFTLEISGAQTQLRFPLSAGAKKASVAGYQTQKQTDGDCPVLVLTDANGFTGTRSFTVMYTISGLASEADGVQTLSLPLMSAKWDYPISKYVFTVTLPKPFESYPAFTSGYHGDVISDYIDLDVSESRITGVIETGLKDHESLEMTLTLDKSYFSGAHTTLSFGWAGTAIILLLLALAFLYWFSSLRSARVRVSSRMLPPDAALPCDMPFLLAGGPIQFNMLVCHWASLGYLTISCGKNERVVLRRRVDMGNERRPAEVRLFQMLFSQGDVCEGVSLLYKRTAEKADEVLRRYWVRRMYRKTSGNPLIMRALGILAGALTAAEAASPILPSGFVRWLLLAGVLISALGAVMDVAVSLAASLEELVLVNPNMGQKALLRSGLNIGKDMIGTMSNTLVFAFAGGSLTTLLVLISYGTRPNQLLHSDYVALELAHGLCGTCAVILTVPLASLAAAIVFPQLKNSRIISVIHKRNFKKGANV